MDERNRKQQVTLPSGTNFIMLSIYIRIENDPLAAADWTGHLPLDKYHSLPLTFSKNSSLQWSSLLFFCQIPNSPRVIENVSDVHHLPTLMLIFPPKKNGSALFVIN